VLLPLYRFVKVCPHTLNILAALERESVGSRLRASMASEIGESCPETAEELEE